MGTILASTLFLETADLMEDTDNVTYLEAGFLRWLNEAQRAIIIIKPDAYSSRGVVTLTAGSAVHSVTDDDVREVLEIYSNTNAAGTLGGRAVIQCDRQTLDEVNPDWQDVANASTTIKNWWLDERDHKSFWTHPPAHASTPCYLLGLLAKLPADVADIDTAITLDDIYDSACIEWIMHRFTGQDSEDTPNWQRSQMHLQKFITLVTGDDSGIKAISAKLRDQIK